jgi:hypothetical protein
VAVAVALAVGLAAPAAGAAPEWIFRGLTLPRGEVAVDVGLGLGHQPAGPTGDGAATGGGLNLEIAFGVSSGLQLGLRTGVRFSDEGRATQADRYARPFETETYGTGYDTTANPELAMRWAIARGPVLQLGLEARAYLPIETGTHFGVMFAVPLWLRLGAVRVDSGIYVPLVFDDPTRSAISFPLHCWIQASRTLWLGPLLGIRIVNGNGGHEEYPLGFGIGVAMNRAVDLRTWFLFPDISGEAAARTFGAGLALEARF